VVHARVPTMRWLVIAAALVISPAANSEPIHLACEGAMRANEPQHDWRLAEKYLMSLVIDMSARTVKPEGHPSVPLKESVDDEDVVAFASPRASDDVLDGRLNRITGEALIHFLTDPMYEFHGRCYRAESLFEKAHAR
jgi:hypothetical protein